MQITTRAHTRRGRGRGETALDSAMYLKVASSATLAKTELRARESAKFQITWQMSSRSHRQREKKNEWSFGGFGNSAMPSPPSFRRLAQTQYPRGTVGRAEIMTRFVHGNQGNRIRPCFSVATANCYFGIYLPTRVSSFRGESAARILRK